MELLGLDTLSGQAKTKGRQHRQLQRTCHQKYRRPYLSDTMLVSPIPSQRMYSRRQDTDPPVRTMAALPKPLKLEHKRRARCHLIQAALSTAEKDACLERLWEKKSGRKATSASNIGDRETPDDQQHVRQVLPLAVRVKAVLGTLLQRHPPVAAPAGETTIACAQSVPCEKTEPLACPFLSLPHRQQNVQCADHSCLGSAHTATRVVQASAWNTVPGKVITYIFSEGPSSRIGNNFWLPVFYSLGTFWNLVKISGTGFFLGVPFLSEVKITRNWLPRGHLELKSLSCGHYAAVRVSCCGSSSARSAGDPTSMRHGFVLCSDACSLMADVTGKRPGWRQLGIDVDRKPLEPE